MVRDETGNQELLEVNPGFGTHSFCSPCADYFLALCLSFPFCIKWKIVKDEMCLQSLPSNRIHHA